MELRQQCQVTNAPQAKPLCGVLAAEALVDKGSWHREAATGHLFWEPSECRLRRLTAQEARSCLAGRHIAFVGDSVSRRGHRALPATSSYGMRGIIPVPVLLRNHRM